MVSNSMRKGETIQYRGMRPPGGHTRQAQLSSRTDVTAEIRAWISSPTTFRRASDEVRVLTTA